MELSFDFMQLKENYFFSATIKSEPQGCKLYLRRMSPRSILLVNSRILFKTREMTNSRDGTNCSFLRTCLCGADRSNPEKQNYVRRQGNVSFIFFGRLHEPHAAKKESERIEKLIDSGGRQTQRNGFNMNLFEVRK